MLSQCKCVIFLLKGKINALCPLIFNSNVFSEQVTISISNWSNKEQLSSRKLNKFREKEKTHTENLETSLTMCCWGRTSTPLKAWPFRIEASWPSPLFEAPLIGKSIGDCGGLIRVTLSFFSSMYLSPFLINCQQRQWETSKGNLY